MVNLCEYDINIGYGLILATSRNSWALPGGEITASRMRAEYVATEIDRLIRQAGGLEE